MTEQQLSAIAYRATSKIRRAFTFGLADERAFMAASERAVRAAIHRALKVKRRERNEDNMMKCEKCGDNIIYSGPDTVFVSTERKGSWPEWSDAICYKDGKFHSPKEQQNEQRKQVSSA